MFRFLKKLFVIVKNAGNNITLNCDISTNTIFGTSNIIVRSNLHDCKVANYCTIKKASLFSCILQDSASVLESILFSTNLSSFTLIGAKSALSNSKIGRYTYFAGNNRVFNSEIGSFCSIAENACIGHAEHPYHFLSTSPLFYKSDNAFNITKFMVEKADEFKTTIIGNDVWIGYNAYVKTGVTIGTGSIIGAGAVVTKDVAPYTIMAGVPAKMIKMRFDDKTIEKLMQDKWWDMTNEDLKNYQKENISPHTAST